MKFLATTALAVVLAACGAVPANPQGNTEQSSDITCSQIDDQTYTSVVDHDIGTQCGTNVNGDYQCIPYSGSWSISFDSSDHSFFWSHGMDGDTGTYSCTKAALDLAGNGQHGYVNVVNGTTLYLNYAANDPDADGLPLQSRSHQYLLDQ